MSEVTIYKIAKMAEVSASTVSRVINNYPFVKKGTRAKVLRVLSECNYVPNETARNLVNQATKMIGILIADIRTTHHTDGVYYVEQEFSKNGYSCLIYNTGTDPENQAEYIRLLGQKKVEAVVLMGSIYQNETVQNAIMVNIPHVPVAICNGYLDGQNIYGVIADERSGVCDCVKLFADKGCKNIAFITNHYTPSNYNKLAGFNEGFDKFIGNGSKTVIEAGDAIEDILKATVKLLTEKPETDALLYAEDFLALIGLHALYDMKLEIPKDVAVIGINNSRHAEISNPALTSLDNMLYDTSLIAVRNLIEVLKGERVNKKIMICPAIVERSTT
ncbi:LacI family DNA-binding transcriptional regulator [Treponema parvum]|uniref:LacI family DNA-binding transcriptional regulator n=1 Tax=Treponema parvum TaxID=138851 RepID=UPI001AEC59EE|nr:LacI family DNA-binding transcriptional regulator [Treponema parvum]